MLGRDRRADEGAESRADRTADREADAALRTVRLPRRAIRVAYGESCSAARDESDRETGERRIEPRAAKTSLHGD